MADRDELLLRARERDWYHTLELGSGVTTDGWFDLRSQVRHYRLPERLDGMRCLEIGTWDGFWAFELERRGAAEVVALDLDDERDLDWPARRRPASFPEEARGEGFRLAASLRGSSVRRVTRSIYDATPEELGTFDLVFCSAVLIHLRDQLLALERMAGLCAPGGRLVLAEERDRRAGLLPWPASRLRVDEGPAVVFWSPSVRAWKRMVWAAGFDDVRVASRFTMRGRGVRSPHVVIHATRR
jgi:tRNA (mo5U34)-methyltransferase